MSTSRRILIKKKDLQNPIQDGRIVSDYTFAKRLHSFMSNVKSLDPMTEEEVEYFKSVASKLLLYQMATVTDPDEKAYFENLGYYL